MEYPSLPQCLLEAVERYVNPRQQLFRTAAGWQVISAREMLRRIAALSKALAVLGVKPGDRVGLLAPNCPEWHIADFATTGLGAVLVPIYFRESAERAAYILNDSGAKVVFTAGEAQARLINAIRDQLASVAHVISVAPPPGLSGEILRYETLIAALNDGDVADYRRTVADVTPAQIATIIYTSGTTGEPKGVLLSHANLTSNALESCRSLSFGPSRVALSFLPLAHVYERTLDYGYLFLGISVAYVAEVETLAQALLEVRPHFMGAVPRVFEKIYAGVLERGHGKTGLKRKIFDWAMRTAQRAIPWKAYGKNASPWMHIQWHLADALVYSKIRAGLGRRLDMVISGGAPLAVELAEFFWSVGVPLYQGYGLTETSPVISVNVPEANRVDTVGRPIPQIEVKIADDGEILVRGPCVMQGYYRKPEATREAFTPDGWFRTGDVGLLDPDGYLRVTDRKKDLIKTAGGKFVAPQAIENRLKTSPLIANAVIVGDKRKFVCALIVPNFARLEAMARGEGRQPEPPERMVEDEEVLEMIGKQVERLTQDLAQYEKPKRFALLPRDFSFDDGALTYTMKVRRRVIEERYKDVIESLYTDLAEPRPQLQP